MGLQSAIRMIFPPQCLSCGDLVETENGLCGPCWRDCGFIGGTVCDACGVPLIGDEPDGTVVHCDDCLTRERNWARGRAVFTYGDTGRRLVLGLKHGDRTDLIPAVAGWLSRAAEPLITLDMVVTAVPLHRWRLFQRRYNQSVLLARDVARQRGLAFVPDMLVRRRATAPQDGMGPDERFANLADAIIANAAQVDRFRGKSVLLVDDVMTSGATLTCCTDALLGAGAQSVSILVLARVAKDA